MAIYRKRGVRSNGIQPECVLGIMLAEQALRDIGLDLTITSLTDEAPGRHPRSFHRVGLAFDARIRGWTDDLVQRAAEALREALGGDWDVVVEGDHIHCEFDPDSGAGA